MMQKRQVIQTHIESESENQNTKGRMETKNLPFFFNKRCWRTKSMNKTSSMSEDGSNLSNSRFGCYFCHGLVNFKNLIILFWNIWVMYGL